MAKKSTSKSGSKSSGHAESTTANKAVRSEWDNEDAEEAQHDNGVTESNSRDEWDEVDAARKATRKGSAKNAGREGERVTPLNPITTADVDEDGG